MNQSLLSLVLLFGAVSAGGTALVPEGTPQKCRAVTTPLATTLTSSLRTRVVVATPTSSVTVAPTPVACDPELVRARALARAGGDGQCCSTKTKKKSQSQCTSTPREQREQEVAYEEAVTRAVEAAHEAARAGQEAAQVAEVRAWANGGGAAELKAFQELAERAKCSGEAVRELATRDRLSAAQHEELAAHAHELAQAGEHMRALHADELAVAQAYAGSELAALEGTNGDSIAEKVRSALGKLGRKHQEAAVDSDDEADESADDDGSWNDDSDEDVYVDYTEEMSDDDDAHESSLEARIEKLEALARERGHDVDDDDDDSKSLEERVASLELLMRGGDAGGYNLRTLPRMRLEALKGLRDFKEWKDWPRVKLGDNEVLIMPEGGWPLTVAPNAKSPHVWRYPQKDAQPGKAPKAKAHTWYWPSKDKDGEDDEVDVPEAPEAPEPPEPPEAPEAPDAFAPFTHGGAQQRLGRAYAPGASAETRREIESLMRDMRSQIDSMRTEMERLREELVRASKRGSR